MKKLSLILISFLLLLIVTKCKKPDNAIYDVLDGKKYGAVLRTLEIQSGVFNQFDTTSKFIIKIEEQDEQMGELLDKVNVYVSFIDKTDDNVDNNKSEVLLETIPASSFTKGAKGLPVTTYSSEFSNAISTLNLQSNEYFGGDTFKYRFELVLTDGRVFTDKDTADSVSQSFFNSPFTYGVNIVCIPAVPFSGDYRLVLHDAYGDGWQGSKIIVTIDGTSTEYSLPDYWTAGLGGSVGDPIYVLKDTNVNVPVGTQTLKWEFVAGSYPGEVTFEIYGPNSHQVIFQGGPSPAEGELFLNYCNE